jgi:hypothetical protein
MSGMAIVADLQARHPKGAVLMQIRYFSLGICLACLFLAAPPTRAEEAPSASQALVQLKAGNARFVSDKLGAKNLGTDRRQ